ncbi:MAG: PA0069 family radical SAM protein [Alphaproteobacteria bacterium]
MEHRANIANDPDRQYRKGRGTVSNAVGRFEPQARVAFDDGWGAVEEEPPKLRTELGIDSAKTIIARNKSPDIPFDRSINPYRGCEHGCVYCFARPTHAYFGLSAGLDFETRLFYKPDAAALLRKELSKPGYAPAVMALGTNTDPYQPVDRSVGLTRDILQVLSDFNHPLSIVTKSDNVLRDIDILAPMAEMGLASVYLSVTTLDAHLANKLEPRASTPFKRLAAVRTLTEAGIPAGVMTAPIIPAITDWEIERLIEAAADHGAVRAGYVLLRLPLEIKNLVEEWLDTHAPDKKDRVLSLVRQTRKGKAYDSTWGKRLTGEGPYAEMIRNRFRLACKKHGLNRETFAHDCTLFSVPGRAEQLALL